jgi:hypothetical protein
MIAENFSNLERKRYYYPGIGGLKDIKLARPEKNFSKANYS